VRAESFLGANIHRAGESGGKAGAATPQSKMRLDFRDNFMNLAPLKKCQ
jgi:hypothetical protein